MTEPPKDTGLEPHDIDLVIKHLGQPLEADRKQVLMDKLKNEQKRAMSSHEITFDQKSNGRRR